jgi:hypothetical protein
MMSTNVLDGAIGPWVFSAKPRNRVSWTEQTRSFLTKWSLLLAMGSLEQSAYAAAKGVAPLTVDQQTSGRAMLREHKQSAIHLLTCEQATCKGWWYLRTGGITSMFSSHNLSFVAQNRSAPVLSSPSPTKLRVFLDF